MPARRGGGLFGFEAAPASDRGRRLAVWSCSVVGLLALLEFLEPPSRSLAWVTFLDAGHAPLFGAIALAVLQILLATPLARRSRALLYGLALLITIPIGALSELLQIGAGRSRDPMDLLRDALGAGAFLLLASTRDPHALFKSDVGAGRRALCCGVALGALLLAFAPLIGVAHAYAKRAAAFPTLWDFEGTWETHFVQAHHARIESITLPRSDGGSAAAARITFEPAGFAALKLLEPYPDWTSWQTLRLVAQSELDRPIELVLRVHDRSHDGRYADRFNRNLIFLPGVNEFAIPLSDLRRAPDDREMDLSAIEGLSLFAVNPQESFSLLLLELRLD